MISSSKHASLSNSSAVSASQALHPRPGFPLSTLLPNRHIIHHPNAGLNILVDCASTLFTLLGKIKSLKQYRHLAVLNKDLLQEMHSFEEQVNTQNYPNELVIVCRYLLCATFDDVIANTPWGSQGSWMDQYSLLAANHQDANHGEKFFAIMQRAIKDPKHYIDLMEVMYVCLSMGYKGQYRGAEHHQYQLELITTSLYHHISHFRGKISKHLSPTPASAAKSKIVIAKRPSLMFIFFVTASIIMLIFIGLSYTMDVISKKGSLNELPQELHHVNPSVTQ